VEQSQKKKTIFNFELKDKTEKNVDNTTGKGVKHFFVQLIKNKT
jgi:hypothetical protein